MSDTSGLDIELTADRVRLDAVTGALVAGECQACGAQSWPRRARCYRCGSMHVSATRLPTEGRLQTWTRVWVPVEGITPPYVVGLVELGEVQIYGHLRGPIDDLMDMPVPVRVRVAPEEAPPFWFEVSRGVDEDPPAAADNSELDPPT